MTEAVTVITYTAPTIVGTATATLSQTSVFVGGTNSSGGAPSGPAGGDLSGSYPNPTVSKVNGQIIGSAATASTSDFATATQGLLADNAIPSSQVGIANGVAPLDNTGKVPAANLPPAPASGVQSVVAGTNVTVDNTDPANPKVSSTGGGAQADWNATSGLSHILNQPPLAVATKSVYIVATLPATPATSAVVIGDGATANYLSNYSVCLGYHASVGARSVAMGMNAYAVTDAIALGPNASAQYTGSWAIGTNAVAQAFGQMMLMAAGTTVTTGGLFQLSAYTVASLTAMSATTAPVGCVALATDALDVGEAAGAGTGCVALKKASGWVRLADNTPLAT